MRFSVGNSAAYNDDCILLLLQHSKPAHKEAKQFLLWKGRGQGSSLDFSDQSKYKTGVFVYLFVCLFVCLFDLGFRLESLRQGSSVDFSG